VVITIAAPFTLSIVSKSDWPFIPIIKMLKKEEEKVIYSGHSIFKCSNGRAFE
jgi:hypothetical protein